jgi:hypothetical protein
MYIQCLIKQTILSVIHFLKAKVMKLLDPIVDISLSLKTARENYTTYKILPSSHHRTKTFVARDISEKNFHRL